jgi:hypothetical protein
MENGPERAEFWKAFILENSGYPATARLREQFENAEFTNFCDCGCNSFALKIAEGANVRPLLPATSKEIPGGSWSIFEVDFMLADDKTLEIIIFADANGNLAYVEVDCCANSYPVPTSFEIIQPPFHMRASENLYS